MNHQNYIVDIRERTMVEKLFTEHELRIGCYVTSKTWGGMHKVDAVSFKEGVLVVGVNGYTHIAKDGVFDEIKAIPLTGNMLKKVGFQTSGLSETLFILEVTNNRTCKSNKLTYDMSECRFQYLHELQDYIYSCTGVMVKTS